MSHDMKKDIAEEPLAHRPYTTSFYAVLLLLVAPLWAAVPLAWLFVIYTLRTGKLYTVSWTYTALFVLALCEVFFSVYHYHLARRVAGPTPVGSGSLRELQIQFTRILKAGLASLPDDGFDEETTDAPRPGSPAEHIFQLDPHDPRAVDFRSTLRNWFGGAPWSAIDVHHVRQWLYWSMFNANMPPLDTLSPAHRGALDETLDLLQKRAGVVLPERVADPSPAVKPILLTVDKVNICWRPFMFYAALWVVNRTLRYHLTRKHNATYTSHDGLEYIIRIPSAWNPETGPRPLVFLHGLGLGLLQYSMQLNYLLGHFTDRPLLFLIQPSISQDIFHPRFLTPLSRRETSSRLARLLESLGWADSDVECKGTAEASEISRALMDDERQRRAGVTMMSHSNGSYTHAWILKDHPSIVTRSCFVDPVTFCSWEGDVCYNFLYRQPKNGLELLMYYFVGSELGVANLLQRHFDWSSNSLFYEEIPHARDPARTLYVLGGKDSIVNAARVKKYLTSHGIRKGLIFDPAGMHGQAMIIGGPSHTKMMQWIRAR
ncbi:hypothetical protein BD626DRAFT_479629 [Schizophyllum amplum]|uniref:Alpha/Beta hydrolase protein n=1 Tax=Schizophyllum amplum TaxID=97359 RepID=A0A550CSF0_9AGAR|nr:hypothetical protein BD626DRAFT_479629 [Auriculariopsis ampla]